MLETHLRNAIRNVLVGVPFAHLPRHSVQTIQAKALEKSDVTGLTYLYLNWVIEKHSQLELRGLGGDTGSRPFHWTVSMWLSRQIV